MLQTDETLHSWGENFASRGHELAWFQVSLDNGQCPPYVCVDDNGSTNVNMWMLSPYLHPESTQGKWLLTCNCPCRR